MAIQLAPPCFPTGFGEWLRCKSLSDACSSLRQTFGTIAKQIATFPLLLTCTVIYGNGSDNCHFFMPKNDNASSGYQTASKLECYSICMCTQYSKNRGSVCHKLCHQHRLMSFALQWLEQSCKSLINYPLFQVNNKSIYIYCMYVQRRKTFLVIINRLRREFMNILRTYKYMTHNI